MDFASRGRPFLVARLGLGLILVLVFLDVSTLRVARAAGPPTDDWLPITPEERKLTRVEQDPESDAVIILRERDGRILRKADDVVNVLDYYVRYKILTERGKRYGVVEIPASKYSRVSEIRARSVKSDGTAVPVAPDQIFEKVTFQARQLQGDGLGVPLPGGGAGHHSGVPMRSYSIDDLDDLDKPLRLKLDIEAPGMVTNADEVMLVRGCVFTCRESNPISNGPRQYLFYVDRGWNEDETVTIRAPEGMKPSQSPPSYTTRSVIGVLVSSCMPQEEDYRCSRTFAARRNRWPASEQTNIHAMFDKIIEADRTTVEAGRAAGGR